MRRPVHRVPLDEYDEFAAGLALSPHGGVLYTAKPLTRHDLRAGTSKRLSDPFHIEQIALSPDGSILAGSSIAGSLLLDPATGEVRRRLSANGEATWMVHFSADGHLIGSDVSEKQEAFVWDVATGHVRARVSLADEVEPVRFSPDGTTLYTAGSDAVLRAWDLTGRRRFIPRVAERVSFPEYAYRVSPGPAGRYVAYPFPTGVRFLDVGRGRVGPALLEPSGVTADGTWAPDGVRYALAAGDRLTVRDARTGAVLRRARPTGEVTAVDFSSDGSTLAVADGSSARLLDGETLRPIGPPVDPGEVPCAIALGPDNRTALLATAARESTWSFWQTHCSDWALVDLRSGAVLHRGTVGADLGIGDVDVSPSGDTAAMALSSGQVLELDLGTGTASYPPVAAHEGHIFSLGYAPDGSRFLTSGSDASAAVWVAGTGRLEARIVAPTHFSVSEFASDGRTVVLADPYRGAVYRWDTRLDYALSVACRLAGRDLTRSEWTDQFGERPFRTTCPP